MIVLGHMSPATGRDIADKVLLDLALAQTHDITRELKLLADCGSKGKSKHNIYRDVYKYVLRAPLLVPKLVQFPYKCIGVAGKQWGVGDAVSAVATRSNIAIVCNCSRMLASNVFAFSRMHAILLVRHG